MNPVFLEIGNIHIYWYSVLLLCAFFIGVLLAIYFAKQQGISKDLIIDYCFYAIPICLIGARIYYVLFNLDYYFLNPIAIFKVWEGGLAIHGGIIAGAIFTFWYTKKHQISFLKLVDILVICLLLGQSIGRWGNFFNGEAYGPIVSLEFLQNMHLPTFIIHGMYIDGLYHQPTFLYESLWCFLGFIILLILKKYFVNKKDGFFISFYLIWYGIERLFVEGLRKDSLMLGNFRVAQIVSFLFIILGILFTIYLYKGGKKHEKNRI